MPPTRSDSRAAPTLALELLDHLRRHGVVTGQARALDKSAHIIAGEPLPTPRTVGGVAL
ncbi:hypothetical protein [Streptomyces sp. WM6378]|uniref:hypothetical protein n=1 Tax=Streptomyces sp. WM6378 TaxID=1415557 RepID=UPI000B1C7AB0|nr:hypothetical protein [Streptomyces sp. WM6378]